MLYSPAFKGLHRHWDYLVAVRAPDSDVPSLRTVGRADVDRGLALLVLPGKELSCNLGNTVLSQWAHWLRRDARARA
jgi:hypothetical protein